MDEYAYIRVSTREQNIDRQLLALSAFDIPKKNIYCDYQSGKDFNRPAYKKLMKKLLYYRSKVMIYLIFLVAFILIYVLQLI